MTTWTGTPTEYERDAHAYRLEAKREYRRARTGARRAAKEYELADAYRVQARWLTRHPDLWELHATPADIEQHAALCERVADGYLGSSFRATGRSRWCRELAGRFDRLAAKGRAAIAETDAQMATARACKCDSSWYAESERWDKCPFCGEPWSWHRDAEPQP